MLDIISQFVMLTCCLPDHPGHCVDWLYRLLSRKSLVTLSLGQDNRLHLDTRITGHTPSHKIQTDGWCQLVCSKLEFSHSGLGGMEHQSQIKLKGLIQFSIILT